MLRFRRMKTRQKFVSAHANVRNHFKFERYTNRRWLSGSPLCASPVAPKPEPQLWTQVRIRLTAPLKCTCVIDTGVNSVRSDGKSPTRGRVL